ncbi:MORC family CW-type Zinc finger protein 3 [Plakobranchus ocellatus]|uniref:MORC family CW-type Zinc finger protein 3 n=1 Tax=Plakobranchus ocellatus TaxID=259542 RepID=A0AAV4DDY3_9GAST|nr:MORC family CW-type Zinc finger protein 3 [Plakobranchus ocellatus]
MEKEKKETKAQMHLSSLHAYSTRHEWVFGAFAEIIDNACNAKASEIWIDTVDMEKTTCLTFLDNGPGMEAVLLYNMLSLQGVRQCRNDLRSSSMRIGSDVLVFTRSAHTASIGFLSQTYLKALKATSIYIPILKYSLPEHILCIYS